MSSFAETLEVGSASGWNKITLQAFGVEFHKEDHTPLNAFITDQKWYDQYTENEDFVNRNLILRFISNKQYFRTLSLILKMFHSKS
jgi:hypothetical protein